MLPHKLLRACNDLCLVREREESSIQTTAQKVATSRWLETHVTCPICRKPMNGDDGDQAGPSQPRGNALASHDREGQLDLYNQEVQFRMKGLHRLALLPGFGKGGGVYLSRGLTAHQQAAQPALWSYRRGGEGGGAQSV